MRDKRLKLLKEAWNLFENIEKKSKFLEPQFVTSKERDQNAFNGMDFEKVKDILTKVDPISSKTDGKNTPYVNAVFNWWKRKKVVFPEDFDKIKELLIRHKDLKLKGSKIKSADGFQSYSEMRIEIEDEWNKYFDDEGEATEWEKYAPTVYSNQKYKVLQVDDYETGKKVFSNSGWCVAHENHFNDYGPPYFLIVNRQSGERVALAHVESEQFKDIHDEVYTERDKYMDDIVVNFLDQELEKQDSELQMISDRKEFIEYIAPKILYFIESDSYYKVDEINSDYDEYFDGGSDFEMYSSGMTKSVLIDKDLIDNFKPFYEITIRKSRSLTGYSYFVNASKHYILVNENNGILYNGNSSIVDYIDIKSKNDSVDLNQDSLLLIDETPISKEKAQEILNTVSGDSEIAGQIKQQIIKTIMIINRGSE